MEISDVVSSNQTLEGPTVTYMSYMADPNGRGTIGLVTSCLLTLLLCVWSALHLNPPCQNASKLSILWTHLKWIAVGVYAPELVVFTAWRQWSSARILARIIEESLGSVQHSIEPLRTHEYSQSSLLLEKGVPPRHKWTTTHCFFASTGGFAFDLDEYDFEEEKKEELPFLPPECPHRLFLTARGVALLAQCGHLPNIAEDEIWDKSKANGLAKALVVIQALWMLLQVIGRLAAHLPVTLLEVNTVAHVLCAFLMYAMWWHKPLMVQEPVVLKGAWVRPLCAYMLMCSEQSGKADNAGVQAETIVKDAFVLLNVCSKTPEMDRFCLRNHCAFVGDEPSGPANLFQNEQHAQTNGDTSFRMQLSSRKSMEILRQKQLSGRSRTTAFFERKPRLRTKQDANDVADQTTVRRWQLASQAVAMYPSLTDPSLLQHDHDLSTDEDCAQPHGRLSCIHPKPVEYVAGSIPNWPYDDLLREVGGLTVGIVLWTCSFVYGGIHAAAWNEHFPTTTEKWFWRSCCLYISFAGGLWIILNSVAIIFPRLDKFWESWMDGYKSWVYSVLLGGCVFICGLSYCTARVFLLVEAFMSIRSLPLQAYQTPTWSQLLPHF